MGPIVHINSIGREFNWTRNDSDVRTVGYNGFG